MLNYQEYEKAVYDWLIAKHQQDPNFTFTVRQSAGKGSETDYFIGTSKSNYFATTFWTLPVSFPGSSGDCISLILQLSKVGYGFYFEFNQTQDPVDNQNQSALNLVKALKEPLQKILNFKRPVQEANKMYTIQVASPEKIYVNLDLMFIDIDKQLAKIIEITDAEIEKEKSKNPEFKAYRVSKNEFDDLINRLNKRIEKHNNTLNSVLNQYDEEIIDRYFDTLKRLLKDLGVDATSDKIYFNYEKDKLIFGIGQRYVFIIELGKYFRMISKKEEPSGTEEFQNEPKAYLNNYALNIDIEPHYNELLLAAKEILEITKKSGYYKFDKKDFRALVFEHMSLSSTEIKEKKSTMALNQILYGPPGTGKTYTLKNKYFDSFTIKETQVSKEQYTQQVLTELSWWQIITLVLLDKKELKVRDIYNHPFIQVKEKISQSKTVMQTIWGQLQSHTLMDCENVNVIKRTEPLYFWKNGNSIWSLKEDLIKELYPESYNILDQLNNFKPNVGKEVKLYEFVTFHQSYSYEDFIEGIKPILGDDNDELGYKIEDGIFKQLCIQAENNPEHDYALFIDEINRGNVSAIFGELITLIEDSKRKPVREEHKSKCKESIEVILPYSKKKFSVPSNLYIIGTMNTADRSVEALDTALRRRFAFEEMMPEPSKITTDGALSESAGVLEGVDLAQVLTKINERIAILLDVDHQIGHSYLINVSDTNGLANAFNNCILPLLKEYFYHDDEKIALVLGAGFVQVKAQTNNIQALFPAMDGLEVHSIDSKQQFELKPIKPDTIITALQTLLNGG